MGMGEERGEVVVGVGTEVSHQLWLRACQKRRENNGVNSLQCVQKIKQYN